MKKLLIAALLALPLLALASPARANPTLSFTMPMGPDKIDAGFNVHLRMLHGNAPGQAGPWYLYWPLEAHFGPPAPTGFPFWPSTMTLPPNGHGHSSHYPSMVPPAAVPPAANVQAPPAQPSVVRPVGYQVPNYWYQK